MKWGVGGINLFIAIQRAMLVVVWGRNPKVLLLNKSTLPKTKIKSKNKGKKERKTRAKNKKKNIIEYNRIEGKCRGEPLVLLDLCKKNLISFYVFPNQFLRFS